MPTNDLTDQDLSDLSEIRDPLGVDVEGRTHYYDHISGTAWVVVDEEIAHVEQNATFDAWIDFVDDHVGWKWHCRDERSISEVLVDTLTLTQGAV